MMLLRCRSAALRHHEFSGNVLLQSDVVCIASGPEAFSGRRIREISHGRMRHRYKVYLLLSLVGVLGACAPSARIERAPELIEELPPIPRQDGPLEIDLVYPPAGAQKPDADSTFLFGSVGTGEAELTINSLRIHVAPNGGFLAYIPVPDDGTYSLSARSGADANRLVYSYASPPPRSRAVEPLDPALPAVVIGGRDTLATGSQIVHAYPSPGADRRWFFPPGTRLLATGRSEGLVRVRLTSETNAWIDSANVRLSQPAAEEELAYDEWSVAIAPGRRHVDVKISTARSPFLVLPETEGAGIVIYGRGEPGDIPQTGDFIREAAWRGASIDSAYLHLELAEPLWGYKAFYEEDSTLVVRLRRPPRLDASNPLRDLRIMVDPGHPPGGAIGPTGLTEADANLAVALKLRDMLTERGAEIVMTRTTASGLVSDSVAAPELWARVDLAVAEDVDLLVSVHNNAFADGVNPFLSYGTETYYFHPFSAPLAEALQRSLIQATGLPNLGARQRSLALVRPSWMPSTLTESLFMMFPQQEAALRDAEFQEKLARAHFEGILSFLEGILP